MSAISKKEVEYIAGLARIKFSDKEKEKMASELGAILGYIDKLKEVNTDNVEPVSNITGLENVLRKDEPMKKPLAEQAGEAVKLIEMAPDSKDNFVKVPAVFEK
ncbi:MAG: Asp-tRNA(Asn)/Glu-tRNA(Gln) amidotransferase subunit GatC [Patescibacteria group bacterium]